MRERERRAGQKALVKERPARERNSQVASSENDGKGPAQIHGIITIILTDVVNVEDAGLCRGGKNQNSLT